MAHGFGRVRVRRVAVLEVHPRLVFDRPRRSGDRDCEPRLDLAVALGSISAASKYTTSTSVYDADHGKSCRASQIGFRTNPAPTQQSGRHSASTVRSISTIAVWVAMNSLMSEDVEIKIAALSGQLRPGSGFAPHEDRGQ